MNCQHSPLRDAARLRALTRRHFFRDCGVGVGKIALASLLVGSRARAKSPSLADPMAPRPPHFAPKVKHVIYLFMAGAPSQLDLFDRKDTLRKYDGKPVPADVVKDQRYAFIRPDASLMASRFKFARHGRSGAELSEMLPHLAKVVDDVAIIKSVHTDQFNHAPAQIFLNTGSPLPGRPSMGSWVTYGLGSEADDLPGFVVLSSAGGISGGAANWSSGFLPTSYQGVVFRSKGDPILDVANPRGVDPKLQRDSLDLIRGLNEQHLADVGDPEIATRISAYEMAYRMQSSAPELMDLSGESAETLVEQAFDDRRVDIGNIVLQQRRADHHGDAGEADVVLQRDPLARENAAGSARDRRLHSPGAERILLRRRPIARIPRISHRRQFIRHRIQDFISARERPDDLLDRAQIVLARTHPELCRGLTQLGDGGLFEHGHAPWR